jgi:hypothetical protein
LLTSSVATSLLYVTYPDPEIEANRI